MGKGGVSALVGRDAEWLVPGTLLTAASALVAFALLPSLSAIDEVLAATAGLLAVTVPMGGLVVVLSLLLSGVAQPLKALRTLLARRRPWAVCFVWACAICFANVTIFQVVKQLLNRSVPFTADRLLADADRSLFLGHDAWSIVPPMDGVAAGFVYHQASMATLVVALVAVIAQEPSHRKSALMMTYLTLWTLVAPLIHLALPAAGPLFYHDLGLGERFAGLRPAEETRAIRDYLWAGFAGPAFRAGGGISAMPSMHVATAAWMAIAMHQLARRWFAASACFAVAVWVLSVALGWHYAVDGLAGAAAAVLVYCAWLAAFRMAPAASARRSMTAG